MSEDGPAPAAGRTAGPTTLALTLARERAATGRRLAEMTTTFDALVEASTNSNADDEHDPEGATIALERAQLDAAVRRTRAHLAELDAADARLAAGTYGSCESCGRPIGAARLEARPTARQCIACAAA